MDCRYCGQPAGFLRTKHRECAERHKEATAFCVAEVTKAATTGRAWRDIENPVRQRMSQGHVSNSDLGQIIGDGMNGALIHVLDDNILDEDEERSINGFLDSLREAGFRLEGFEHFEDQMKKASVLRLVMEGKNPALKFGITTTGFRFMKSEAPIWRFEDVGYEITKTRVRYTGGSRGMSVRVARGVYLRTGGFRGERHVEEERHLVDSGDLVITTKHVYFRGESHRFRVRHDRVVAYDPLQDGFEMTRDRVNARPERFYVGDGWFVNNLLMNAPDLE